MMPSTANVPHPVAYAVLPHPEGLWEPTTAFDTAIDRCDAPPTSSALVVVCGRCGRQRCAARLLCRLEARHALQRDPVQAHGVPQLASPLAVERAS